MLGHRSAGNQALGQEPEAVSRVYRVPRLIQVVQHSLEDAFRDKAERKSRPAAHDELAIAIVDGATWSLGSFA
ncbi:hypothetical protein SKB0092_39110 (plasmid) [Roseomonas mucosa]